MPSIFDTHAAPLVADAVQDHYGEPIVYRPMRRSGPNGGWQIDPMRPVVTGITGAFVEVPEDLDATGGAYDRRADQRLMHASARLAVQIRLADLGYDAAAGDVVERTDKGERYTTGAPARDGSGGVELPLNKAV